MTLISWIFSSFSESLALTLTVFFSFKHVLSETVSACFVLTLYTPLKSFKELFNTEVEVNRKRSKNGRPFLIGPCISEETPRPPFFCLLL